ncbi:YqgE/AlgH family protein [Gemmobacter serpentinus]|uniref:YqgE/AlgH family protein n=1 Tax=Gemmobacter serpentinus TaxID=2652247 RepID=UPI00124D52BE|nr:YqgE/AlgH family protein [Gemmobacter serpentinus]
MDLNGSILIAMPGLGDPRFEKSVILICAHGADGAMGLILNKPSQDLDFPELLDHLSIPLAPQGRDIRVHFGGPVERGRGFVLHSNDYHAEVGTMAVAGGLAMTATLDILQELAQGGGPREALLALGYAGWGPGQLEDEIARNDWLTAVPPVGLVFSPDDGGKWAMALRGMGIDPLLLSSAAGRA